MQKIMRHFTTRLICLHLLCFLLSACGFHLQGEMPLAPPLHRLYLQTADPYGSLSRSLQQYLKMSHVQIVSSPAEADTILVILHDDASQEFLSVDATQQTRQFNLKISVSFEITNNKGQTLVNQETASETRTLTVQSDQILGSSNEMNVFYQQMRHAIAYVIMNRLTSNEVTRQINHAFRPSTNRK